MKIKRKISLLAAALLFSYIGGAKAQSNPVTVAQAFYEFASRNNTQKIESLLHRGYSLESVDERGYNPVCLSVIKQNRSAYKVLTSYGADKSPSCLKNIPESAYRRFFGMAPEKTAAVSSYKPDTPYLIGAAALGVGAVAVAYIFRGDTDKGDDGGDEGGNGGDTGKSCDNGTYDEDTKKCNCWNGYGNYGDDSKCYTSVANCEDQNKATCRTCKSGYILKDNICYPPIANCQKQDGNICTKCYEGFVTDGGDGTICYTKIANCQEQDKTTCVKCNNGYGTYGDKSRCYQTIEHCSEQIQTACAHCDTGYDTYGDQTTCYSSNPCAQYANTIPVNGGESCVCNENKGYTGEPGNCTQTSGGDYQEGDGNTEEWNNLNELYCNSHGKYDAVSKLCLCYSGYTNSENGCADCEDGYLQFNGLCFKDLQCETTRGEAYEQKNNICVCKEGYIDFNGICTAEISCPLHHEQTAPGPDPETACTCKPNFKPGCEECEAGFELDTLSDSCVRTEYICTEKWTGASCEICPLRFKIETDTDGTQHCGRQCAENRLPIEENSNCTICAEGYEESGDNCIINGCSQSLPGYIHDDQGNCICDTANGYAMSPLGQCMKKDAPLIGIEDTNINNNSLTLTNDGNVDPFRDVYGMKPVITDEEGNVTGYYDNVYNALSSSGTVNASIDITNANTGTNIVYGIYSPSSIYNAGAINTQNNKVESIGSIKIKDNNTLSEIYGMYNTTNDSIYNAFAYNSSDDGSLNPAQTQSTATGSIVIEKDVGAADTTGSGSITGISGSGNILNAYAVTSGGTAANTKAESLISITHNSIGTVTGIYETNQLKKVNNALSYLDSAVSDAVSLGQIILSGNDTVYGIFSAGTVVNSETQFNKSYNKINNFSAEGIIDVMTSSEKSAAYGIYVNEGGTQKVEIYNALGYNTTGNITITNINGGSAYGIWNGAKTYIGTNEDGNSAKYYNNTYNAFRSSAKYGGDNVAANGTITININNKSNSVQNATGIYAVGNVFNAYANSGSDVKLESIGNIIINDNSRTNNIVLKGIESGGVTIANAYATGQNANTSTIVSGNVEININDTKGGGSGLAAGIYSEDIASDIAKIYNAALINDKSNVEGTITVQSAARKNTFSQMYGIYAASSPAIGSSNGNGQPKIVYNAYYDNSTDIADGHVLGMINVTAPYNSDSSLAQYYGIFINEGTAYNVYTSNTNADVVGIINVNVAGGRNSGTVAGMYGNKASLYNSGTNSTINVSATGNNMAAYGLKGDSSYLYNSGNITVTSSSGTAYGLYVNQGQAINDVGGVLTVNGKNGSYGIYVLADGTTTGSAQAVNLGTINLNGETNNVGIYASGSNATVENNGIININGEGQEIQLENGATLVNNGTLSSSGSLNLSSMGGAVVLTENGKFETVDEISGNIEVSSDVVMDTFARQVLLEDAVSASDVSALTTTSQSYLYTTSVEENNNGKYDVSAQIKDFSEITTDRTEAAYLNLNYDTETNSKLFNALKSAATVSQEEKIKANVMGTSMIPNIVGEELKVQRSLDRTMSSELFKEGGDVRKIVGGDAMYVGRDDRGTLTGYDINSQSMYALYDTKLNNRYRMGLGMSFTHTYTDYNDDSTRKNFMIQGYVPLTYRNGALTAVSMARLGYADGEYSRRAYDGTYKADTKAVTYGLLNEARYKMDMGLFGLTPFAGLNAIGWYQDSINEGNADLALKMDSKNIFSLESALGLYLDKEIEFNEGNMLNIALGIGWYHEFADPYSGFDARHAGSIGGFRLRNKINSRDRGILSAKFNYDYKNFSIYGELMQYLEEEHPIEIEGGLKYRF